MAEDLGCADIADVAGRMPGRRMRHTSGRYGEEVPLIRHALELVGTTVGEPKARSGDEILHRARNKDLAAGRGAGDPRAEMDGQPFELGPDDLDLTGVETLPDAQVD